MDFEMHPYIVYVKTDEQSCIIDITSSAFLTDASGWVEIASGYGDRFHHAQGNFLELPLTDERGIYRYKLEGITPVLRTAAEMDADWVDPPPQPSDIERIEALEEELAAAKILLGIDE